MQKSSYHHGDLKRALIEAGIELLAKEGSAAFSLRKVAIRAGVSHTAPYAHFADKQALIAAIITEGYIRLHKRMLAALENSGTADILSTSATTEDFTLAATAAAQPGDVLKNMPVSTTTASLQPGDHTPAKLPRARLLAAAMAYVRFAMDERELFGIIFSGLLEDEKKYPEYVAMTQECYGLLLEAVRRCHETAALPVESEEIRATRLWSCLHGFASLLVRGQISHVVLDKIKLTALVEALILPRQA
ncbi:MAG: TetR/AcrR family transcriptional regulator [Spirochaetes bacterium]|nr:TetR/AcrR family transcriptional regulator [Spirochaetota bacterium]MBU0954880.1 TetR/AcrR family transcriptional regulator [Spirochaetota bacterium]